MKRRRVRLACFFAAAAFALAFVLPAFPAWAAENGGGDSAALTPYTYTVTIYSGDKGHFGSTEGGTATAVTVTTAGDVKTELAGNNSRIKISGLSYGDRIYVNFSSVPLYDAYEDTYSAWGVRRAGRDSSTAEAVGEDIAPPSFEVTQDADYVIAYSLLTDPASYTVRYLEKGSGKELRPAQSGRADIGKKIYIGAEAVSGYVPDANNKSLTLDRDPAKNEIVFYYSAISHTTQTNTVTETETVTTTETQYVPGGVTEINLGGGAGAAGAGGADTSGTAGAAGAAGETGADGTGDSADEEGGQAVAVLDDEEIPLGSGIEEPQELVDLDDGDIPLGLLNDLDEGGASRSLLFVYIAIALLGALGFFGIIFFLLRRKKEEESGGEESGRR